MRALPTKDDISSGPWVDGRVKDATEIARKPVVSIDGGSGF